MAPQKADNENLNFLYTCFKSAVGNGGKVDIAAIAATYQINVPAASMRLSRLRKALDARTGQNADGEGDNDAADMTPKAQKTQKSNGKQSTPASARKVENGEITASSRTPAKKSKKRKITEVEQAGIEQFEDGWAKLSADMQMNMEEDAKE